MKRYRTVDNPLLANEFHQVAPARKRTRHGPSNVLRYHYLCDIELCEIAQMMEVSPGRVSQFHRQALHALHALYQADSRLNISA
nr:sigma factor-like helix-turn-helix DNA-binding protein [Noviherbaspirillum sp. L7-7A]